LFWERLKNLFQRPSIAHIDERQFWKIIALFDWSKEGDDDAVMRPAIDLLAKLPLECLQQFDEILAGKLYTLDAEPYAKPTGFGINHFSVDMFLYNRCCVVGNGKAFYERVLKNPSLMIKELDFESLLYLTYRAGLQKGIQDYHSLTQVSYETFSNEAGWQNVHFPDGLPPGHLPKHQRK
jgi:hypothetical protein